MDHHRVTLRNAKRVQGPGASTGRDTRSHNGRVIDQPTWTATASFFDEHGLIPAAKASGWLLSQARPRWDGSVVARSSMHDLLFTRIDDPYPFERTVRVFWADDVYTFTLTAGGLPVSGDRSRADMAVAVLDAFLSQLAGDAAPSFGGTASG